MNNFEKYNKLHTEVMARLEGGEITIEMAKELNDLSFNKYIVESVTMFRERRIAIGNAEETLDKFNKVKYKI